MNTAWLLTEGGNTDGKASARGMLTLRLALSPVSSYHRVSIKWAGTAPTAPPRHRRYQLPCSASLTLVSAPEPPASTSGSEPSSTVPSSGSASTASL